VVLAHPERYPQLQRDPDRVFRLVEQGVLLQVTTACIAGLFGKSMQKLAQRWLQQGVVHVLSSDAHSMGQRMVQMPAAFERVRKLVGNEELHRLTIDAPYAILTDGIVPQPLPIVTKQPTFFGSLFRR
jgi:protein-tyrosine phosphatase